VPLAGRYREPGVDHAERLEQSLGQELGKGLTRGPRHQHAQDVGAGVVEPGFTRLVQQRDAGQRRHPLVRCRDELRLGRPLPQLAEQQADHWQREVGREAVAGAEAEQVEHGDRPDSRDDVVDRAGRCADDRP
jgi:hypothetical protein